MVLGQLQELVETTYMYSLDGNTKELPPIPWELLCALAKSDKGRKRVRKKERKKQKDKGRERERRKKRERYM